MRVRLQINDDSEEFSKFLLDIGNGTYPISEKPFNIQLP